MNLLFNPDKAPQFGREFCFLCGAELGSERNTDEHVIPKWVQERYQLWDQKLTLLNRTTIPYRLLTIPCCAVCNNVHLGRIEGEMQRACDQGAKAVLALPPIVPFIWTGKILYGLLYREHLLSWSRREPEQGPIVPQEILDQFRLHHQFLQAARIPFEFMPELPASLFFYETMEPSDKRMGFDYFDSIAGLGLSIRVGKVGIIACLQDGGAVKYSFGDHYQQFQELKLHWIQFAEITAATFYDLSRFNRTPKFMLVEGEGKVQVAMNPLGGLSGLPLFNRGSNEEYAPYLAHFTRFPREMIEPEPGRLITWVKDSGRLKQMLPDDPP